MFFFLISKQNKHKIKEGREEITDKFKGFRELFSVRSVLGRQKGWDSSYFF